MSDVLTEMYRGVETEVRRLRFSRFHLERGIVGEVQKHLDGVRPCTPDYIVQFIRRKVEEFLEGEMSIHLPKIASVWLEGVTTVRDGRLIRDSSGPKTLHVKVPFLDNEPIQVWFPL